MPAECDGESGLATLENGVQIQVPLFIAPGETVRIDLKTGRYLERVRGERKKRI